VRRTLLTVLALLGLCLAVPSPPAQADSSTALKLTGFADLVVDQTHGHVFVSQGTGTVVVTDLTGHKLGAIAGLTGSQGMTLSDDASQLFVAGAASNDIAAVDTTQPLAAGAVTTLDTGADSCPTDVAYTAGLVWYDASPAGCGNGTPVLHALDPASPTPHDLGIDLPFHVVLFAGPSLPSTLFVQGFSANLTEYAATGGDTPALVAKPNAPSITRTAQFALTGDGSQIVTGSRASYATADLSPAQNLGLPPGGTNAVAVRGSDDLTAFGSADGVVLYRHGAIKSFGTYHFDDPDAVVLDGGLAFGGSKVYAVTHDEQFTPHYAVQVITPHNRSRAKLSLTVSGGHHRYGKKATLTATLHSPTQSRKVTLLALTTDGLAHLVKTGKVDPHGRLQVKAFMTEAARFAVVFDGDAKFASSAAITPKVKVAALVVAKLFKATGHSGRYALYKASKDALLGAAVGPDHRGDCLFFRAQFRVGGHWGHDSTTGCVTLNKHSAAGARLSGDPRLAGIPIRMRAEWKGDVRNTKANSTWRYLKFVSSRSASPRGLAAAAAPSSLSTWTPKIRAPFSQQTARSQSSPSSSLLNPASWSS
jgi:hypothetical protein